MNKLHHLLLRVEGLVGIPVNIIIKWCYIYTYEQTPPSVVLSRRFSPCWHSWIQYFILISCYLSLLNIIFHVISKLWETNSTICCSESKVFVLLAFLQTLFFPYFFFLFHVLIPFFFIFTTYELIFHIKIMLHLNIQISLAPLKLANRSYFDIFE